MIFFMKSKIQLLKGRFDVLRCEIKIKILMVTRLVRYYLYIYLTS